MDMLAKIESAKFHATEADVEALAAVAVGTSRLNGVYMRVLIAGTLDALGAKRRPAQLGVFEATHQRFYAAVLRGVDSAIGPTSDDTPEGKRARALERNRQGVFARSAASTVRGYLKAGGDLRSLDVTHVTKGELRATYAPAATTAERRARAWERAHDALLTAAKAEGKEKPEEARERVEGFIAELREVIESLNGKGDTAPAHERPAREAHVGRRRVRRAPGARTHGVPAGVAH